MNHDACIYLFFSSLFVSDTKLSLYYMTAPASHYPVTFKGVTTVVSVSLLVTLKLLPQKRTLNFYYMCYIQ